MEAPDHRADHYTYADYLKWPPDERWELIEGRPYAMTPAPMTRHQRVLRDIFAALMRYFAGKPCEPFFAPLDVRFPENNEKDEVVDTVVQPDILVVCDPAKIDEKGVRGAPDLVIEILSESTAQRDLDLKLRLYEKHGVRCYIIADPWGKTLMARYLEPGAQYALPEFFAGNQQMPIRIFEGLVLDLARVFANL